MYVYETFEDGVETNIIFATKELVVEAMLDKLKTWWTEKKVDEKDIANGLIAWEEIFKFNNNFNSCYDGPQEEEEKEIFTGLGVEYLIEEIPDYEWGYTQKEFFTR